MKLNHLLTKEISLKARDKLGPLDEVDVPYHIHKMGPFVVAMSDINEVLEYLDRMIRWRQRVHQWEEN